MCQREYQAADLLIVDETMIVKEVCLVLMQLLMLNKAVSRLSSSIGWYMYRMCANAEDPNIPREACLHGPRLISRFCSRHNVVLVSCPSCCISFDWLMHIWPRHTNAM
jgi:hypothetical protein